MNSFPSVAVVILNWNGKNYLSKFLPSVLRSTYQNLQIIVADNDSSDDSLEFLRNHYPDVRIISNEKNFGFAEGYNKALIQVEADYYILLNSDVEVTEGWIEPVISMMENDLSVAAAQPKLKDWNNRQLFEYAGAAGGFIDGYGYPFCRGRIFDTVEKDEGQYDTPMEVFWASGAAFFIRKSCWYKAGGFDADFFAHMEEIDLCWRLKNLGYKIVYCPDSTVYHIGGGTLDAGNPYKTYLNYRNNLVMMLKNLPPFRGFLLLFIRFWLDLISLLKFLADGKVKQAWAISRAHRYFFLNLFKNRKKAFFNKYASTAGCYKGSIVWAYFVKKAKKFSQLTIDQ